MRWLLCFGVLFLAGCEVWPELAEPTMESYQPKTMSEEIEIETTVQMNPPSYPAHVPPPRRNPNQFFPRYHHKTLSDYASQLVLKLRGQLDTEHMKGVAVASFVRFDNTLSTSNALGNQLAENLLAALAQVNIHAVDVHMLDSVASSSTGDVVFSRQHSGDGEYEFVLAGSLIQRQNGVEVHARLMQRESKAVVAASELFIPEFVVRQVTGY